MKTYQKILTAALILLLCASVFGQGKTLNKSYSAKKKVRISAVSGDCIIQASQSAKVIVDLQYDVTPEGAFTPEIREQGSTLRIKEIWHGSSKGHVRWILSVPADVKVDFSSASGSLSVDGTTVSVKASTASGDIVIENAGGNFDISTASGEVELTNVKGEFDISTASGDIDASEIEGTLDLSTASGDQDIADAKGIFDLSCASGTIDVTGAVIEDASSFSTASGKVDVSLAAPSQYDLELSSASGNALLNYKGKPLTGTFIMTARKDRGRIVASTGFDKEEEFERNKKVYMRKIISKGGTPEIRISTSSGRAVLK